MIRAIGQPFVMLTLSNFGRCRGIAPRDNAGASSLFNMTRNLGGSFGTSMISTVATHREHFHFSIIAERVTRTARRRHGSIRWPSSVLHGSAGSQVAQNQALAAAGGPGAPRGLHHGRTRIRSSASASSSWSASWRCCSCRNPGSRRRQWPERRNLADAAMFTIRTSGENSCRDSTSARVSAARPARLRRLSLAAAGLVLTTLVAGCGGSGGGHDVVAAGKPVDDRHRARVPEPARREGRSGLARARALGPTLAPSWLWTRALRHELAYQRRRRRPPPLPPHPATSVVRTRPAAARVRAPAGSGRNASAG